MQTTMFDSSKKEKKDENSFLIFGFTIKSIKKLNIIKICQNFIYF